ncbi:MAG: flagellar type III secretion system protein FliQ [Candidatus Riflebacteria bacterium]|nr:flagellar type III secretion system protein FliQ [Candidatus Riflebacteria bacterium]
MTEYVVLELIKETFWISILLTTPILLIGMIVGILISIIQTATSIQEQSLTVVPKLIITVLAIMGMSRWMLSYMIGFATKLLGSLDTFAGL